MKIFEFLSIFLLVQICRNEVYAFTPSRSTATKTVEKTTNDYAKDLTRTMSQYTDENVKRVWAKIGPSLETTPTTMNTMSAAFAAITNGLDDITAISNDILLPDDIKVLVAKTKVALKAVESSTLKWFQSATAAPDSGSCAAIYDIEQQISNVLTSVQSVYECCQSIGALLTAAVEDQSALPKSLTNFQIALTTVQTSMVHQVCVSVDMARDFVLAKSSYPSQVLLNASSALKSNLSGLISLLRRIANAQDNAAASDLLSFSTNMISVDSISLLPSVSTINLFLADISANFTINKAVQEVSGKYVDAINRLAADAKPFKSAKSASVLSTFVSGTDAILTSMSEEFELFMVVDKTADLVLESFQALQSSILQFNEIVSATKTIAVSGNSLVNIENAALQMAWSVEGFATMILNFAATKIRDCSSDFDATFVSRSTLTLAYVLHLVIVSVQGVADVVFSLLAVASQLLYNIANSLVQMLSTVQPIWKSLSTFLNGETVNIQFVFNGLSSMLQSSTVQLTADLIEATTLSYKWSLSACIQQLLVGPLNATIATANSVAIGIGQITAALSGVTLKSILSVSQQMSGDFEKNFAEIENGFVKHLSYEDILYARIKDPVTPAVHSLKFAIRSLIQTVASFEGTFTMAATGTIEAALWKIGPACQQLVAALLKIIESSASNEQVTEYLVKSATALQMSLSFTIGVRNFLQQLTGVISPTMNRLGYILSRSLNHLSTILAPICIDTISSFSAEFGLRNSENVQTIVSIMKSSLSLPEWFESGAGQSSVSRIVPWTLGTALNGMLDGPLNVVAFTVNSKVSAFNELLLALSLSNAVTVPICLQNLSIMISDFFRSIKSLIPHIAAMSPFTENDLINTVFGALQKVELTLQATLQTLLSPSSAINVDTVKSRIYPLLQAIREFAVQVFYPVNFHSMIEWTALNIVLGGYLEISFGTLTVFANVLDRFTPAAGGTALAAAADVQSILLVPIESMLRTCGKLIMYASDSRSIDHIDMYLLKADSILTAMHALISISAFSSTDAGNSAWSLTGVVTSLKSAPPINIIAKTVELAIVEVSKPASLLQMTKIMSDQFDNILLSLSQFLADPHFQTIQNAVNELELNMETILKVLNSDFEDGASEFAVSMANFGAVSVATSCQHLLEAMAKIVRTTVGSSPVKLSTAYQVTSLTLTVASIFQIISKQLTQLSQLIKDATKNGAGVDVLSDVSKAVQKALARLGGLLNGTNDILASPSTALQSFIGQLLIGLGLITKSFKDSTAIKNMNFMLPPTANEINDIFIYNVESAVADVESVQMYYATAKTGTQNLQKLNSVIVLAFKRIITNVPRIKIPSEWQSLTKPFISLLSTVESDIHVIVDKFLLKLSVLTNGAVLNFKVSVDRLYSNVVNMINALRLILQNCIATGLNMQLATYLTILQKNILIMVQTIIFGLEEFANSLIGISFDYLLAFAMRLTKSISILSKPLKTIAGETTNILLQKKDLIDVEDSLSLIYTNVETTITRFETTNYLRKCEWISANLSAKLIDLPISQLLNEVTSLSNVIETSPIDSPKFELDEYLEDLKVMFETIVGYPLLANCKMVQSGATLELLGHIDLASGIIKESGISVVKKFHEYAKTRSFDAFKMIEHDIDRFSDAFHDLTVTISQLTDVTSEIDSVGSVKTVATVMMSFWSQVRGSQTVIGSIQNLLTNSEYKSSKAIKDFERTLASAHATITHCLLQITDNVWDGDMTALTEYLRMVNGKTDWLVSAFDRNVRKVANGISDDVGTLSWNILFQIAHIENLTIGNNVYAVNTAVTDLRSEFSKLANSEMATRRTVALLYNLKSSVSPAFTSLLDIMSGLKVPANMTVLLSSIVSGLGDVLVSIQLVISQLLYTDGGSPAAIQSIEDVLLGLVSSIQNLTTYIGYIIKAAADTVNDMEVSTSLTYIGFSFGSVLQIALSLVTGSLNYLSPLYDGSVNKILYDLQQILSVSILFISDLMGSFSEIYDKLRTAIDSISGLFNANFPILSKGLTFNSSSGSLSEILTNLIGSKLSVFSTTLATVLATIDKLSMQTAETAPLADVQWLQKISAVSIRSVNQICKGIFAKASKSFTTQWSLIATSISDVEMAVGNLTLQLPAEPLSSKHVTVLETAITKLSAIIQKLFAASVKFIQAAIQIVTIESSQLVAAITLMLGSVLKIVLSNLLALWNLCQNVANVKSSIISGSIATIADTVRTMQECFIAFDVTFSLDSVANFHAQVNVVMTRISTTFLPKLSTLDKSVGIIANGRLGDVNGIFSNFLTGSPVQASVRPAASALTKVVTDISKMSDTLAVATATSAVTILKNLTTLLATSLKTISIILSKFSLKTIDEQMANILCSLEELTKVVPKAATTDASVEPVEYAAIRSVSVLEGFVHLVREILEDAADVPVLNATVAQLYATVTLTIGSMFKLFVDIMTAIRDLLQKSSGITNKILSKIVITLALSLSSSNRALDHAVTIQTSLTKENLLKLNNVMSMISLKLISIIGNVYKVESLRANRLNLALPLMQLSVGSFGIVTNILDVAILQIDRVSRPLAYANVTTVAVATEVVNNLNTASTSIFKVIGKTLNCIETLPAELVEIGKFGKLFMVVGSNVETLLVRFQQSGLTKTPAVSVIEANVQSIVSSLLDVMNNLMRVQNGAVAPTNFVSTLTLFLGAVVQIVYNIIGNITAVMSTFSGQSNKQLTLTVKSLAALLEGFILHVVNLVNIVRTKNFVLIRNNDVDNADVKMEYYYSDFEVAMKKV